MAVKLFEKAIKTDFVEADCHLPVAWNKAPFAELETKENMKEEPEWL